MSMKRYAEERLRMMDIDKDRRKDPTAMCTAKEISTLRGAGGALLWLAREGRPDFAASSAMVMSWDSEGPNIQNLIDTNKLVAEAKATSDEHIRIPPIPIQEVEWCVCSMLHLRKERRPRVREVSSLQLRLSNSVMASWPHFL